MQTSSNQWSDAVREGILHGLEGHVHKVFLIVVRHCRGSGVFSRYGWLPIGQHFPLAKVKLHPWHELVEREGEVVNVVLKFQGVAQTLQSGDNAPEHQSAGTVAVHFSIFMANLQLS